MKRIVVLSGKGGTGKTTVAGALIHLSGALRFAECDVDAPNLHLAVENPPDGTEEAYFGLPRARIDQEACDRCGECAALCRFGAVSRGADGRYDIDPLACEGCALCEMACESRAIAMRPMAAGRLIARSGGGRFFSDARLNPGGGNSGRLVSEVKRRMNAAGAAGDLAVIDGSPGIGCPVIASVGGADLVLIVTEPTLSGISDMERVLRTAAQLGARCAVCVNKADGNPEISDGIEAFCARAALPFLGRIPFDREVVEAVNAGESVVLRGGAAAEALRALYGNLTALLRTGQDDGIKEESV